MGPALTSFLVLAGVCIVGPYALGLRPASRRHWLYLAVTIGFLVWLLPFMTPLRSR